MRWSCFFLLCSLLLAVHTSRAAAQSDDRARAASARALFEEGVAHVEAGRWSDARDRFQRALALRESQVIRFNLAAAEVELGLLVEASELYRQVERDPGVDEELRAKAHARLEDILPRIGRITVRIGTSAADFAVTLDERPLDPAQLDVALPANPGAHRVAISRSGRELDARELVLGDGEAQTVTLDPNAAAAADPGAVSAADVPPAVPSAAQAAATIESPASSAAAPLDDRQAAPSRKRLWWGVGGGVAAAAAIAVFAGLMIGKSDSGVKREGDFDPGSIPVQVE